MNSSPMPIGATKTWVLRTFDPLDGVTAIDADSTPTVAVRKNGASIADSVTVTKRAATTGIYDCSYDPATAEAEGDHFTIEESAIINEITYPRPPWGFSVLAVMRGTNGANATAPDNSGIAAIKAKTDNLPADPAGVSNIPTTADIEGALLNEGDGQQLIDAIITVINSSLDVPALELAAIANAVRTELATELARIDATISSRMATTHIGATAGKVDGVATVDTCTTNADMRGTDGANTTTPPTAAANATAVRSELATELGRIDATITSRSAPGDAMALTSSERITLTSSIWNALTSGILTVGSIGKLLVDRMATILKLDATLESDGATYRFNSNALEQAPGGGVSLSGVNTVTITVDDGTNPLESARVRITKGAQTEIRQTNGGGQVVFSLDDGTWTVAITLTGYTFTATSLAVSGDETATYSMTALALAPAETPAIRNYLIVRSLTTKAPIEGALVRLQQKTAPSSAGNAVAGGEVTALSNESGEAWFYVLPGEAYTATLPDGGKQTITVESTAVDGDPLDSILISL